MKKGLIKEINTSLNKNKNLILYDKLYSLNNRINSANPNKINQKLKFFHFIQNKIKKNNTPINSNNNLSPIKCISYKKLFNFDNVKNKNNKNQKLFILKNFQDIFNNNINFNFYNSISHSSRKITGNYYIRKEKILSSSLIKNKNKTIEDFYHPNINNKNNQFNHYKKLNRNNSQFNFFKNNRIIINKDDIYNKRKFIKNIKHSNNSEKTCTNSNSCDASTNTFGIFNNKIINSDKKYKRPLMIDYSYSEHKKFYYGFDKLRGKNKYKKPYFIVHKY